MNFLALLYALCCFNSSSYAQETLSLTQLLEIPEISTSICNNLSPLDLLHLRSTCFTIKNAFDDNKTINLIIKHQHNLEHRKKQNYSLFSQSVISHIECMQSNSKECSLFFPEIIQVFERSIGQKKYSLIQILNFFANYSDCFWLFLKEHDNQMRFFRPIIATYHLRNFLNNLNECTYFSLREWYCKKTGMTYNPTHLSLASDFFYENPLFYTFYQYVPYLFSLIYYLQILQESYFEFLYIPKIFLSYLAGKISVVIFFIIIHSLDLPHRTSINAQQFTDSIEPLRKNNEVEYKIIRQNSYLYFMLRDLFQKRIVLSAPLHDVEKQELIQLMQDYMTHRKDRGLIEDNFIKKLLSLAPRMD